MEKVLGIGGFFFRSYDPAGLAAWYNQHLGIDVVPKDYDTPGWRQSGGSTVFAPFAQDTKYFGAPSQQWMINFRVSDLDAMARQLEATGITVDMDKEIYPNGRFAQISDPDGNPVQLWQPMGADADRREP